MASSRSGTNSRRTDRNHQTTTPSTTSSSHNRLNAVDYCIRILNYLIGSLKLHSIPPIVSVDNITIHVLLQIHCKLMGWDFANEYIPSRNPKDDAERIILSLKDKFGSEKFDALDADRIVQNNPVHLRFLVENYHLIHDHQFKRSLGLPPPDKSSSGHHLAVAQPSDTDLKGGDSFYVFPNSSPPKSLIETDEESDPEGEATSFLDSDFETLNDLLVNVYDSSTADETLNDSTLEDSLISNTPNNTSTPSNKNKIKRPLSSSPVDNKKWNQSSLVTGPNVSSIKGSPSKKVQRTIETNESKSNRRSPASKFTDSSNSKRENPTGSYTYSSSGRQRTKSPTSKQSSRGKGQETEYVDSAGLLRAVEPNKTKRPLSSSPVDNKKLNQSSLVTGPSVSSIKGSPSKKVQLTIEKNKTKRPLSSSPVDNKKLNQSSLVTGPSVSSIRGSPSKKIQRTVEPNKTKRPLSSSPVDKKKLNQSSLVTGPSVSSVRESPSKKVQRHIETNKSRSPASKFTDSSNSKRQNPTGSYTYSSSSGRRQRTKSPTSKQSSRRKGPETEYVDSKDMNSMKSTKSYQRSRETFKESLTKTLSLSSMERRAARNKENKESAASEVDDTVSLQDVRDVHQSIRKKLTESWGEIDSEINKLKEKGSNQELKDKCPPQPIPNLRWMMPVDLRFPYYPRGIIHPKCRKFRNTQIKNTPSSSKPSRADFSKSHSSTAVENGSGTLYLDQSDTE